MCLWQYSLTSYDRLPYLRNLWESGTAFHHAGILPAAKEIVERLFTAGLIASSVQRLSPLG